MVSAPRGLLRLVSLQLLSEYSLSGSDLQEQIRRTSTGAWRPGPGSIYFMLDELRNEELVVELPRKGGTMRRYVISSKGKAALERLRAAVTSEVKKQLELLAFYSDVAKNDKLAADLRLLALKVG